MNCSELKLIFILIGMNVTFSLAQFLLEMIKDRTKTKLDDRVYNFVHRMNDLLRWISASRR